VHSLSSGTTRASRLPASASMLVEHRLAPGKLVIIVQGVESLGDLHDLDVGPDRVTFVAHGQRHTVALGHAAIDVDTCGARFKKKRLELLWQRESCDGGPVVNGSVVAAGRGAEAEVLSPAEQTQRQLDTPALTAEGASAAGTAKRADESADSAGSGGGGLDGTVRFRLREAVRWALEQLERLRVPESATGLNRFKAEVGLAELGLYASRCSRLGVPTALLAPLRVAEDALHAELAALAAGEMPGTAALSELTAVVRRTAAAVADVDRELTAAAPAFGARADDAIMLTTTLGQARWRLRDGTELGPGIGTWKLSPEEAEARVVAALRGGWRHVDTAAEYGTEAAVGRALTASGVPRCEVFVNLKVAAESASELRSVLAASLRNFGGGAVDCLMLHRAPAAGGALQEPLIGGWAQDLGASPAELLAQWARGAGVCPLVRCSPGHAAALHGSRLRLPPRTAAALSALSSLTETAYCPALSDPFGLHAPTGRRLMRCGEALRGRLVQVHGLGCAAGRPLNGCRGRLEGFDDDAGRWDVAIPGASEAAKLRPENLALVEEHSGEAEGQELAEAAGRFLRELLATGGLEPMLRALAERREEVTWALEETVAANLEMAAARGWAVKQQVLARLLGAVREALERRSPHPGTVALPPPTLDLSAIRLAGDCWDEAAERALAALLAALEGSGYAICDGFAGREEVAQLATELGEYDTAFETAKILVGKQATGAEISVPAVRSDRIFWVCGEHRTPAAERLWDSAGTQPAVGLAPCRPEVVMSKAVYGFPRLAALMRRLDDFVLGRIAKRCDRLKGLVERSDAMVSIYDKGARFQKHIDNPNRDGRVLTSVFYLNPETDDRPWSREDGGHLRVFLGKDEPPADFAPECGRLALFWADRIPHEVLPSRRRRRALTYWWFDRAEREAKVRETDESGTASMQTEDERLAQAFVAHMLRDGVTPAQVNAHARNLPAGALDAVAKVVGAEDGAQALEGLERLSQADLERLRGSMQHMGLE